MNELIINALKEGGIETEGLNDAELLEAYNKMLTPEAEEGGVDATAITEAVNAAVKPLTDKIEGLEGKLNKKDEEEIDTLAKVVGNSDKFPGLTEESAKVLPVGELINMAAACGHSVGVPLAVNIGEGKKDAFSAPSEMADSGGAS